MHKRAREHKAVTPLEIESKLKDKEYAREDSHGMASVIIRRQKRWLRYCLMQWSIYGRRPWEGNNAGKVQEER